MRARRRPVLDEYHEDGEAAVFVDGNVVVLSPLATHLLILVGDDWTELAAIASGLEEAFGPPPGETSSDEATRSALGELQEQGILDLRP